MFWTLRKSALLVDVIVYYIKIQVKKLSYEPLCYARILQKGPFNLCGDINPKWSQFLDGNWSFLITPLSPSLFYDKKYFIHDQMYCLSLFVYPIVTDRVRENEAVKLIRLKEGLMKLSQSFSDLGRKCVMVFDTQQVKISNTVKTALTVTSSSRSPALTVNCL